MNQDNYGSEYRLLSATEQYILKFRHSNQTAKRSDGVSVPFQSHNVFVEHTVFATTTVPELIRTSSTTVRVQKGDDPTTVGYLPTALGTLLTAQLAGFLQGES
jgi:hypothetical protein